MKAIATPGQALTFIRKRGVILESARIARVPNLADVVIGKRRSGSWWGHERGKHFFWLTRSLRTSPDVLVCRLVAGKITYVHKRLWPDLARLAPAIGAARLAAIREVHLASGAHRVTRTPFRRWAGRPVFAAAARLTAEAARRRLAAAGVDLT
jgi:hypothetical protein